MVLTGHDQAWAEVITMPIPGRVQKPRVQGLTMVIDKGLGLNSTADLLSLAGDHIDFIKLGFGSSALYNTELLAKKISLVRDHAVHIYPGGTMLEIAVRQNVAECFLQIAWKLGFSAIEVSDGTVPMTPQTRSTLIKMAKKTGFLVLSEAGKKDPAQKLSVESIACQVEADLVAGAAKVILEARESGKGIGIFNDQGEIRENVFSALVKRLPDTSSIIWEAPLKNQQEELIHVFGPNVNLGNIPAGEVIALESLRTGLRSDTLKTTLSQNHPGY